ncbi:GAF domain-containing protein [Varibaculum cambriense]|uniref:sensor histidine kinase n=1 Tax=Varibaculum cambriense TaxID=184870 RepID=UPI002902B269|nr:GAF domain-containing protein [Varibaculum cambriense]MDU1224388.1 GAF domain-containing protein [Varibaculum cambriense]
MSSNQQPFPLPHLEPETNEAVLSSPSALSAEKNLDSAHRSPLPADSTRLISSVLQLMGNLEQDKVLQAFVDQACEVTSSPYGALSILGSRGETSAFYIHGVSDELRNSLGNPPVGRGIIGDIPLDNGIISNDLHSDPRFTGYPPTHPEMTNFLGVPLRIHEQVYGRLYLCNRPGGYSDQDLAYVSGLAILAAVAVENSRLYEVSRSRERWTRVSQQLTTILLEGTEEEDALQFIAKSVREVADADTSLLILPSVGDTWVCEIASGYAASDLIGVTFPPHGRARTVLEEGQGLIVDSLARATTLRVKELSRFGAALYAPLLAGSHAIGVLLLLRLPGKPEFDPAVLEMAEQVATQAALALEIAGAKHAANIATLLDERAKIGEDLHDLAIQQLFATGMQLERIRAAFASGAALDSARAESLMQDALASVDDSVKQIRAIVHNLREPDAAVDLVERLRREASLARRLLGFAPSFVLDIDGEALSASDPSHEEILIAEADQRVGHNISDDVVAVVRETLSNTARHAGASSAQVVVSISGMGTNGSVRVVVTDDGHGLDPTVTRRSGLDNLKSRARRHGGICFTKPASPHGLQVIWEVPLG